VKRLAIFVEGETEQLFAAYLVQEMANAGHLEVKLREARGGRSTRRRNRIVEAVADNLELKYFVLIVDCGAGTGLARDRLDAGGGVDEVAGDHALSFRADRDCGFSGEDTGTGAKGDTPAPVPLDAAVSGRSLFASIAGEEGASGRATCTEVKWSASVPNAFDRCTRRARPPTER
jgi:hypothetical protein